MDAYYKFDGFAYRVICAAAMAVYLLSASPAQAAALPQLADTPMFHTSAPAVELFREKQLKNNTVLQSIAFDPVHQHVFIVQLIAGGQRFAHESVALSGAERARSGDLVITQLDMNGRQLGYMFLLGFGHGVSIGVELEGGTPYIWTEIDAQADTGGNGWGKQLTRFAFENGALLTANSPNLEKYSLLAGADRTTVNIDQAYGLLTMRYRKNNQFRFAVYPLAQVKNRNYTAIADIAQPKAGTFQGFASHGRYLYMLEGNAYGFKGITAPEGNTYITTLNVLNGQVMDKQLISAGADLRFREPEGMGVYIPNRETPQTAELYFGFASTVSATDSSKLVSIYGFRELLVN